MSKPDANDNLASASRESDPPGDQSWRSMWRATSWWEIFLCLLLLLSLLLPFVGFIGGGWVGGMVFGEVGKKPGAVVFALIGWIVYSRMSGHNAIETGCSTILAVILTLAAVDLLGRK